MMDFRKSDDGFGIALDDGEKDNFSTNEKFDLNLTEDKKKEFIPSNKLIRKSMMISEIVDSHPEIIPELMSKGMHCIGCHASPFETLEEGFIMHGLEPDEVDTIVEDLNKIIDKNSKPVRRPADDDDFY
jgi:hybrid cluster-associated redox disulfide protein